MTEIRQDIRFGIRMLRKTPGFTLIAILTMGLAIGATTAIFSIMNVVLLKPLGFSDSARIVAVWEKVPDGEQSRFRVAPGNFFDWKERSRSFEKLAAFGSSARTLTGVGDPQQLRGAVVSADYFELLDVKPVLGRTFLKSDHDAGSTRVVILSQSVWQSRFNGDPAIEGKPVTLDGESYIVRGIVRAGLYPTWPSTTGRFSFDRGQQQFWIPLIETAGMRNNRRSHVWGVIGRLKNEISIDSAQAEMSRLAEQLARDFPQFNEGESATVSPLRDEIYGDIRPALTMLFGAVLVVLLIACANIAGLLLSRFADRRREIAIRTALGAGRGRLIRQFLIEGLLISILGGLLGIWIAAFGLDALLQLVPGNVPRLDEIEIDRTALACGLLLSLATGLFFTVVPAWRASAVDSGRWLGHGGRGADGGGHQRFRGFLVVAQICLSAVLVIGAALLVESYRRIQRVEPGFLPDRILVAELELPSTRYSGIVQIADFYSRLTAGVRSLPGIQSVALAYDNPLEANWIDSFEIEGRPATRSGESTSAWLRIVSDGYFQSMGIGLVSGREFAARDEAGGNGVLVINESFARQFFPGENPVGRRIRVGTPSAIWGSEVPVTFEIAGVARDVRFLGLQTPPPPAFYLPFRQFPQSSMKLIVRASGDPAALSDELRRAVLSIDRDQPVASIISMDELMADQYAGQRFNMVLLGLFGLAALLLAMIGIFGLVACQVVSRTGELGIRMALGAQTRDILVLVIGGGLALALAGIASGLALALALGGLIQSQLFGVSAADPLIFAGVALLLVLTTLAACLIPARRAIGVDPAIALRNE
ncbi:MAG: ABC transporter permease [Blastocatellales bacterium]